jgi:2-polyprenyl-6-methoxyphenol hydroxylase-like FAD-dependent oxidoreductase
MALEDAAVLAKCLTRDDGMGARLRRYESLRFKRTGLITRDSKRVGQVGQMENPLAVAIRTIGVRLMPTAFMEMRHRLYYSFDA